MKIRFLILVFSTILVGCVPITASDGFLHYLIAIKSLILQAPLDDGDTLVQTTYNYDNPLLTLSGNGAFIAVTGRSIEDDISYTGRKYMIDVYNTATGELVLEYDGSEFPVTLLSMSQDGQLLSFANNGGILAIISTVTSETIQTLAHGFTDVGNPCWSPDDQFFAFISGRAVPIFDADDFQTYSVAIDIDNTATVIGFAWHPSMARLATSMYDPNTEKRYLLVWSIIPSQFSILDKTLAVQTFSRLSWHPNEETIVTNQRGGVRIIDIASGTETFLAIPNPDEPIYSVDWSPDGTKIAGGGNQVYVWDVETRTIIETIQTDDRVRDIFWSPDGQYIYHTGGAAGIYCNGTPLMGESNCNSLSSGTGH